LHPDDRGDVSPEDSAALRSSLRLASDVVDPSWPDFEELRRSAVRRRRHRTSLLSAAAVLAVAAGGGALSLTQRPATSPGANRPVPFATHAVTSTAPRASPSTSDLSAVTAHRSATAAQRAAEHAAYVRGTHTFQDFLDSWASDGLAAASEQYLQPEYRASPGTPVPVLLSGTVVGYHPVSWTSPGEFTLALDLDLHFAGDAAAWAQGRNERFVTFERQPGPADYLMSLATGP
jgi:hypothetical protein